MHPACHAVLLTVLTVLPCHATTIRVDVNGGGDYLTIGEGVAAASAGDTVLVAPGTYVGEMNRAIVVEGQGTLLVSEDGPASTVIDCKNASWGLEPGPFVTIEGFTITKAAEHSPSRWVSALNGSAGVTVRDCIFTENAGTAVNCAEYDSPHPFTVEDCSFVGNEKGLSAAVHLFVERCDFIGNHEYGLASSSGGDWSAATSCNVTDCLFEGNGGVGLRSTAQGGHIGFSVFTGNGDQAIHIQSGWVEIERCTIVRNHSESYPAVRLGTHWHVDESTSIRESIVAFNSCVGAINCGGAVGVHDNVVFGNAGGDSLLCNPAGNWISGNVFEDPLFCDVMQGDVSLCEDSPWLARGALPDHGCPPCESPVEVTSWGTIKAMFR